MEIQIFFFFFFRFDVNSPHFFTPTVRSRIVQFILDRNLFSINESDPCNFGIEHLVNDGVYLAAYPLHDVRFILGDKLTPVI